MFNKRWKVKTINFHESFEFQYFWVDKKGYYTIGMSFRGYTIAKDWTEIVDFTTILEMSLRGKLGEKNRYELNDLVIYGKLRKNDGFYVCIEHTYLDIGITEMNPVEVHQVSTKLNKLLHQVNKLATENDLDEYR